MREAQRLAYLEALGIPVWRQRPPPGARGEVATEIQPQSRQSAAAPGDEIAAGATALPADAPAGQDRRARTGRAGAGRGLAAARSMLAGGGTGAPGDHRPASAAAPSMAAAGDAEAQRTRASDGAAPSAPAPVAAAPPPAAATAASAGATTAGAAVPAGAMSAAKPGPREHLEESPPGGDESAWQRLREEVAACQACGLAAQRTQTVFGVGPHDARLLLVGEAPGAEEDRYGEPFVGRAGQLLTAMLKAIGLQREQVFIANVLKCRPPGNRNPSSEEARTCRPFLDRQIALLQPHLMVALGKIAAQQLTGEDLSIARMRGQRYTVGPAQTPLLVTYHPAYLLRQPAEKAKAWQDLQRVAAWLREPPA